MEPRFERNIPSVTEEQQDSLRLRTAAVIGLGGLGGHACELLSRLGIGTLILCDGDRFSESNLNRQVLSHSENLGENKAEAAALRAKLIDPQIRTKVFPCFLTAENAAGILSGADIVIDALDSVSGRLLLEDACADFSVPLVHGAISGWDWQAAFVTPGSGVLKRLYEGRTDADAVSVLPMTAAFCASLQVSLCLKYLLGEPACADTLFTGSLSDPSLESLPLF